MAFRNRTKFRRNRECPEYTAETSVRRSDKTLVWTLATRAEANGCDRENQSSDTQSNRTNKDRRTVRSSNVEQSPVKTVPVVPPVLTADGEVKRLGRNKDD